MKIMKLSLLFTLIVLLPTALIAQQKTSYRFSFGSKEITGYIKVDPSAEYSEEQGYGFDFGTAPVAIDRNGKKPLTSGFVTSEKPFFFSVALPEGNYNIKVMTGDLKEATVTTVRAESRRLIFEKVKTAPGKFATLTATINVRMPEIAGTNEKVIKKPRELYKLDWDNKMTFEFTDTRPCICVLEITKVEYVVTVYLAAAKKVAQELNVAFIDLNAMTKTLYEALGPENSKKTFVIYPANSFPGEPNALNDNTHFNSYGAYQLTKCIIEGIKANNLGIRKYLIKGLPAYDPAKPDPFETFSLPLSPHSPVIVTN